MWRRRRLRPLLVTLLAVIGLGAGVPLGHTVTTTAAAAGYDYDHPAAFARGAYSSPLRLTSSPAARSARHQGDFTPSRFFRRLGVAAEDGGGGFLSNLWSRLSDETGSLTPPVKTPWGWSGSASYRAAVSEIGAGGTLETVGDTIPSQAQAERLIEDAGGTVQRIEEGHLPPNPHQYPHINYTTASGLRGTVQITEVAP